MKDETTEPATTPTPTVEEEIAAIKAVLSALLKLPNREAQGRVLAHARMYLGGDMRPW